MRHVVEAVADTCRRQDGEIRFLSSEVLRLLAENHSLRGSLVERDARLATFDLIAEHAESLEAEVDELRGRLAEREATAEVGG